MTVNLQLQRQRDVADRQYKGPIDLIRQVYNARGVKGFYRGFGTTLYFRGCFFWMFGSVEAYMRLFGKLRGTRLEVSALNDAYLLCFRLLTSGQVNNAVATGLSGGLAAFSFWFFAMPMDNVKK